MSEEKRGRGRPRKMQLPVTFTVKIEASKKAALQELALSRMKSLSDLVLEAIAKVHGIK